MLLAVAVFAFVFVALSVAGVRVLNALEAQRARLEAQRREAVTRRHRLAYNGPIYNAHGREVA